MSPTLFNMKNWCGWRALLRTTWSCPEMTSRGTPTQELIGPCSDSLPEKGGACLARLDGQKFGLLEVSLLAVPRCSLLLLLELLFYDYLFAIAQSLNKVFVPAQFAPNSARVNRIKPTVIPIWISSNAPITAQFRVQTGLLAVSKAHIYAVADHQCVSTLLQSRKIQNKHT